MYRHETSDSNYGSMLRKVAAKYGRPDDRACRGLLCALLEAALTRGGGARKRDAADKAVQQSLALAEAVGVGAGAHNVGLAAMGVHQNDRLGARVRVRLVDALEHRDLRRFFLARQVVAGKELYLRIVRGYVRAGFLHDIGGRL